MAYTQIEFMKAYQAALKTRNYTDISEAICIAVVKKSARLYSNGLYRIYNKHSFE